MELFKQLNAWEIVSHVIGFLILLVILRVFLWKHFLKLLDDRKKRISDEFEKIEDIKALVLRSRAEYEERLGAIEETARTLTHEAISEGKRMADEIRENAKHDAEKIIENAKATIKDEMVKAKTELKDDIVNIAIGAAEKVIEEKMTEGEDKKIVEDFLKRMDRIG